MLRLNRCIFLGASALLGLASGCGDDTCAGDACGTSTGGSGGQGGGGGAGGAGLVCPASGVYHGPWALRFDQTSAVVRWDACSPGDVAIVVEPEAGGASRTVSGGQIARVVTTEHYGLPGVPPDFPGTYYRSQVTVDGLTAGDCYAYSVVGDPERKGRFCAAHAPQDSFGFMAVGDTNPGISSIEAAIEHILQAKPDFSIHLGDIQYYSSVVDSWSQWFISMQPMLSAGAFEPSVGNHESEGTESEYVDYYARLFEDAGFDDDGGSYYRFQSGGLWFFSIDTEIELGPGTKQGAWLEAMLADASQQPGFRASVVYMHRPFLTVGDADSHPEWRAHYEPIFEQYGARLILAGHMHGYERFVSGGVTYVVSGGGGGLVGNIDENVLTRPDEAALRLASAAKVHGMMFDVGATGIHGRAIDPEGESIDEFDVALP